MRHKFCDKFANLMSQSERRGRDGNVPITLPSLVADNSIACRSLAICTTTKEISSILLGNEGDGDSGLSCVRSVDPHL